MVGGRHSIRHDRSVLLFIWCVAKEHKMLPGEKGPGMASVVEILTATGCVWATKVSVLLAVIKTLFIGSEC